MIVPTADVAHPKKRRRLGAGHLLKAPTRPEKRGINTCIKQKEDGDHARNAKGSDELLRRLRLHHHH
jgi:hypothetical protein